MPEIAVILCTHNPRPDYLTRALEALAAQTYAREDWELLIVDNASKSPLPEGFDVSWHPHARVVREERLGLTPARLRGIMETSADVIVFVDDDNLLEPDYLRLAREVAGNYPFLGAWGGSQIGVFEVQPPEWAQPYLSYLAVREVSTDRWSNDPEHWDATPYGAGLCVRRLVAAAYANTVASDPLRLALDRQGKRLMSGGDIDLARTSCGLGLGFGVFARLRLTHLIPAARLQLEYLADLVQGSTASAILLQHGAGTRRAPMHTVAGRRLRSIYHWLTMSREAWRLHQAKTGGEALAARVLATLDEKP